MKAHVDRPICRRNKRDWVIACSLGLKRALTGTMPLLSFTQERLTLLLEALPDPCPDPQWLTCSPQR